MGSGGIMAGSVSSAADQAPAPPPAHPPPSPPAGDFSSSEAFASDVVGIPNLGTLRISDTLTDGEGIQFMERGLP